MSKQYTELAFEAAIEAYLLEEAGYEKRGPEFFDKKTCLDIGTIVGFIQQTQPKEWNYLKNILKERAEEVLVDDLCKALNSQYEGCLNVLRHGFKSFGRTFKMAFFAPATGLNPDTFRLYQSNKLMVTRQLHYSEKDTNKSLDVVLSVNGIPFATAELKNPMTGQGCEDAKNQYKRDRDPNELLFQFKKRTLVHFAVDPDEVHMTTLLKGTGTVFLPFNKGDNGGAGNPQNGSGYKTEYLWKEVWQRDSILDILARFIQKEVKEDKIDGKKVQTERILFPRYHQLDCVRKLLADARANGPGKNYLIQHSAGSGKSNSIGWLAHRLSSLHDANEKKVFDSIIVITDRIVLDGQLKDTIYQFEHVTGVVEGIDKGSAQLAEAIKSCVPIIVTTLQKFPFVTEKLSSTKKRKYAVIIDEAHSSQGGEMAADLKGVLAESAINEEVKKMSAEEGLLDFEEEILRSIARRGRQENVSFFAFTATPKYKTLEVFGVPGVDGKPMPFHLYSMRQAIEEGFILDVLKNYTTYKVFYQLVKSVEDDPEVDKRQAAKALTRFMTLHPHNIAQKTELIIEHFRISTQHKVAAKAKAMLVTASRLHAVKYKLAFDKYIAEKGYADIKTLVAFSGSVKDPENPSVEYTEVLMNGGKIKESELREEFKKNEYKILIVAEKYQTGFDQPLLQTMYVDKRLDGVQAVQTLSRLNRRIPYLKEDSFVLDFVNDADEIQKAFQPYYEQTTVGQQVDVRQLYELKARLEENRVLNFHEIEEFSRVFYKPREQQTRADHARLNACLGPCARRFSALDDKNQEEFRVVLLAFKNLYNFLSQVIPFRDFDLERMYTYIRYLLKILPGRSSADKYELDDDVSLKYYRLEKTSDSQIQLVSGVSGEVRGPSEVGTGAAQEPTVRLSQLIDRLNERFSTSFTDADQLFFDSIRQDAAADEKIRQAAMANTVDNFGYVFKRALDNFFVGRMEQNQDITTRFLNDPEFRQSISDVMVQDVYDSIRADSPESRP